MRIEVDKNFVKFNTNNLVNKREFKATPLEFSFSKDYEGLTCKAVFSVIPKTKDEEITFYQQPIINNKCYIPYEVMEAEGILIGVYGYSVEGDELLLRYSPEPKNLWFLEGSYYEGAEDPEEILPSQFEQYVAYLNSQIARLDQMKIETEDLSNGVKISITNSNGITTETTIYDGERGPEGPQGEPGSGISGKIYNFVEDNYYEVTYTSGEQLDLAKDLYDDIKNNRSFTTSLTRPLYIATGESGLRTFSYVDYELGEDIVTINYSYVGVIGDYFESTGRPGLKTTSLIIYLTDDEVTSIKFPYIDQTVKRYLSTINTDSYTPTEQYHPATKGYVDTGLSGKQDSLVSGTNIKTINSKDITGSGNVDIIQISTLPTADSSNLGVIYQYIGTTTNDYTNGYFYKCVSDGGNPATYSWENIEVQSGGAVDVPIYVWDGRPWNSSSPDTNADVKETWDKVLDCFFNNKPFSFYMIRTVRVNYQDHRLFFNISLDYVSASNMLTITPICFNYENYRYAIRGLILNGISNNRVTYVPDLTGNNIVYYGTFTPAYNNTNVTNGSALTIDNTKSFNPTANYHPATKKYVDDKPTTYSGYDATKTQVLKNINGTLTWVDEV